MSNTDSKHAYRVRISRGIVECKSGYQPLYGYTALRISRGIVECKLIINVAICGRKLV